MNGHIANAIILLFGIASSFLSASTIFANEIVAYQITGDAVPKPLASMSGVADRGRRIIVDRQSGNCLICHSIRTIDEPFQGVLGPSLDGIASRLTPGQIRLRLIDSRRINPATIMPPYYSISGLRDVAPAYRGKPVLAAQQIEDVVAYLVTLKE